MSMSTGASSPDEYAASFSGWVGECLRHLRKQVIAGAALDEQIKWGHLVYFSNGPVLYIRATPDKVYFGFWRGKRLCEIEAGLKVGGKYEMAKLEILSKPYPSAQRVQQLVQEAVALNARLGNPQDDAKK